MQNLYLYFLKAHLCHATIIIHIVLHIFILISQ